MKARYIISPYFIQEGIGWGKARAEGIPYWAHFNIQNLNKDVSIFGYYNALGLRNVG